jgi:transposase-like protein
VAALTKRVSELEARQKKNSKNSNKPPSSDGLGKGAPKNSREPSGKASGGQKGHEGKTKELSPSPDTVIELKPVTECGCGGEIVVKTEKYAIRQVTDIEPAKVVTVEYRAYDGFCEKCGKLHKASFPAGVGGTVNYGEGVQAILTYLTTYQLIPVKRAAELVEDMFGLKVSQGTVVSAGTEAYGNLEETEAAIKQEIIESDVAGFDESGMRVEGKTHWLHSAGTESATCYGIHPKRGKAAMDEIGILPVFEGAAIHDHFKSYYHYDRCVHGECCQHILRALKYLYENLGIVWAFKMAGHLLRIKKHVDLSKVFGADRLEQADISEYGRLYRDILAESDRSKNAPKDERRLANRLIEYEQETLLFMLDFDVPFTNNLAERDIRMPKAKQKISGGFRTCEGAKSFARIRSFVSTCKKKGKNVFDGLSATFKKDPKAFLYPLPL